MVQFSKSPTSKNNTTDSSCSSQNSSSVKSSNEKSKSVNVTSSVSSAIVSVSQKTSSTSETKSSSNVSSKTSSQHKSSTKSLANSKASNTGSSTSGHQSSTAGSTTKSSANSSSKASTAGSTSGHQSSTASSTTKSSANSSSKASTAGSTSGHQSSAAGSSTKSSANSSSKASIEGSSSHPNLGAANGVKSSANASSKVSTSGSTSGHHSSAAASGSKSSANSGSKTSSKSSIGGTVNSSKQNSKSKNSSSACSSDSSYSSSKCSSASSASSKVSSKSSVGGTKTSSCANSKQSTASFKSSAQSDHEQSGTCENKKKNYSLSKLSNMVSFNIDKPQQCDKLKEIGNCLPFIEVSSMDEIKNQGYTLETFIVSDDCYKFYAAKKNKEMILCKMIEMDKCSPRYRENMIKYSLKIARFLGGLEGKEPVSKHFINIHEIFKLNNEIYMFMEECPKKSLYLILLDKDPFTAEDERNWIIQIVRGVGKMQEYGIAHRFLKLQHILFDGKQNVKIAGWSKSVTFWDTDLNMPLLQNRERKSRKNNHLPPEAFRGVYDPSKVDMWSVGVLMVCLNTKCYPFNVRSTSKFSAQWRQFVLKNEMNRYVRAACNKTFFIDPKRRAKASDFLNHPYFKASVDDIKVKQFKTTVDPKYDPNTPVEKSLKVSKVGLDSSDCSQSNVSAASSAASNVSGKKSQKIEEKEEVSENGEEEGDDNASGVEGGSVGEKLSPEEVKHESHAQESAAPEEQANQADPVLCEPSQNTSGSVD